MNRNGWIGKALLVLAVVVPVAGFAGSIYLATSGNSLAMFSGNDRPQNEAYVLTGADFPESTNIGDQVGQQVPEFNLELADGTRVASASLVEEGQPTYLFFWATI